MCKLTLGLAAGVMGVAIISDKDDNPSCCSSLPAIGVDVCEGGGNLAAILLFSFGVDGRAGRVSFVSSTLTVATGSWDYNTCIN